MQRRALEVKLALVQLHVRDLRVGSGESCTHGASWSTQHRVLTRGVGWVVFLRSRSSRTPWREHAHPGTCRGSNANTLEAGFGAECCRLWNRDLGDLVESKTCVPHTRRAAPAGEEATRRSAPGGEFEMPRCYVARPRLTHLRVDSASPTRAAAAPKCARTRLSCSPESRPRRVPCPIGGSLASPDRREVVRSQKYQTAAAETPQVLE